MQTSGSIQILANTNPDLSGTFGMGEAGCVSSLREAVKFCATADAGLSDDVTLQIRELEVVRR